MSDRTPVLRRALLLLGAVVTALLVLAPTPAHAENSVVGSTPEDGAVLGTSPTEISISFAAELGEANTITLECDTELITLPRPTVLDDGITLDVQIPEPLGAGTCVARWRVSNPAGEPDGAGSINFTVEAETPTTPAPGTTAPDGSTAPADTTAGTGDASGSPATTVTGDGPDVDGTSDSADRDRAATVTPLDQVDSGQGALWLGRWLSVLGLAVVFGALVTIAATWPEGVEYLITIRFMRIAWVVALVGTLVYVVAASAAVTDESFGAGLNPAKWLDLIDAGWPGRAALARLVLTLACVWVAFRPDRVIDPATQMFALGLPALAVATIGLSRTGGDLAALGIAMGILHALAMAVWVGGAILLARVVLAGPGEEDLVHAVRGFSRLTNGAIIVTVVTGIVQMIRLDGGSLFSSSHGRVVLFKAVLVAAMVFVAMSARQFVARRLGRAHELTVPLADRLRRAFGVEALFGVGVLAASSWMLALDPPNIETGPTIDYAIEHRVEITEADLDLTVKLTNDAVGRAGMEVDVDSPDSGLSGLEIEFIAPDNDQNVGSIVQPIPLTGAGVAVRLEENGLPLNFAGDWTLVVSAVTQSGAVTSEPWQFTLLTADGTAPVTTVTLPPASTVTLPPEEDG